MAQGESPRNPLAFASVLCPGRCLAVELVNSCAYWELPNGNAQRTQDLSRTFTPAEFSHSAASSFSSAASSFSSSCQALVVCLRPLLRIASWILGTNFLKDQEGAQVLGHVAPDVSLSTPLRF